MSARVSSSMRAPTPTALMLFVLLLGTGSSWWRVADGVRTTPRVPGQADDGVLGEAAPAAGSSGTRSTDKPDQRAAALPPEEVEGRPAAVEGEELWAEERRAATGSRLPDCAHACGPCSPCRRVMVSFMCAQGASESCPVAYRCMCRGRFFRVPSL